LKPVRVKVNDKMQKGYVYWRTKPMGREFRLIQPRSDYGAVSSPLDLSECYGMIQGFGDCVPNTKLILNHTSIGVKIPMLPVTDSAPILFRGSRW
jgi:hypothetical protein